MESQEAFNMIDQNSDGFIDKEDLIEMLTSLGKNPDDKLLETMINEVRTSFCLWLRVGMFWLIFLGVVPALV